MIANVLYDSRDSRPSQGTHSRSILVPSVPVASPNNFIVSQAAGRALAAVAPTGTIRRDAVPPMTAMLKTRRGLERPVR